MARIKKVERVSKGIYKIHRSSGIHNVVYDEIEASSKREAEQIWYERQIDALAGELEQMERAGIDAVTELITGAKIHTSKSQPMPVVSFTVSPSHAVDNSIPTRLILFEQNWRHTGNADGQTVTYLQPSN